MIGDPRGFLAGLFDAAVAAGDPATVIGRHLPDAPAGRTIVIGAGKASAGMAQAFEKAWAAAGRRIDAGLVVTRYGHAARCEAIEIVEAAHPVPDAAGRDAALRMLDLVSGLSDDDLVVALISGGGSALLTLPPDPVSFADKQAVHKALLRSGATITEMNCVRKHLSRIKGGRLAAAAAPARVVSLVVSDIPGDDPALVASGPTIPDPATRQDALAIVKRHGMDLPAAAMDWLGRPDADAPHPDDAAFAGHRVEVIAAAQLSLEAAAAKARDAGVDAHILSDAVEGEARDVAAVHAAIACQVAGRGQPFAAPCVLLSGGETTVTVRGTGKGGRNAEFALAFARHVAGIDGVFALAADTDGIDGSEDNAGAFADGDTVARLRQAGHDPAALLADNDAYSAFAAIDGLLTTGPTRTNVNDFRAILIGAS